MSKWWFLLGMAVLLAAHSYTRAAPAFPGVVGFGQDTTGGRLADGNIYRVINTATEGTGSLNWALAQPGPRIILFETGGVIADMDDIPGDTTIFGQTAPGDGIAITAANTPIVGDNVIIRGLRIYVDDDRDGLRFSNRRNIVIDRSSFAWAGGETISTWQDTTADEARFVTFSYNVLYEGLTGNCPGGSGDWEGHGMNLAPLQNATIYRNLMINLGGRAPAFSGRVTQVEVINNIIWLQSGGTRIEPLSTGLTDPDTGRLVVWLHYVSNDYRGVSSITVADDDVGFLSGSKLYVSDNIAANYVDPLSNTLETSGTELFTPGVDAGDIVTRANVESTIIDDVGPIPRDTYLSTAIGDFINNNKKVLCPADTPALSFSAGDYETEWGTDTDGDSIPDAFETANGLNVNDASDANDLSADGYMWIEEFANSLFGGYTPPAPPTPNTPPPPAWFRIESL